MSQENIYHSRHYSREVWSQHRDDLAVKNEAELNEFAKKATGKNVGELILEGWTLRHITEPREDVVVEYYRLNPPAEPLENTEKP